MEPTTIAPPDTMTLKRAAERLGMSVGTIRNWIDTGKLAGARTPGGTRRPLASDVERLCTEIYGTPDLVLDTREDKVPRQSA